MINQKKINSHQYKCTNCGSNLMFSPNTQGLLCPSCDANFEVNLSNNFLKHNINEQNLNLFNNDAWQTNEKIFKCNNCGANVILGAKEYSQNCPYCATALVANDSEIASIKPDQIIPFKFNKSEAVEKFRIGVRKKFFLPNKFKKTVPQTDIYGVYVPAFSFDAKVYAKYDGKLIRYEKEGDQTISSYFSINGEKTCNFNNLLIESSSLMDQHTLNTIKPYNTDDFVDYNNQIILGYSVECFDSKVNECFENAKNAMKNSTQIQILKKYSYDEIEYFKMDLDFSEEKYSYCLIPVYEVKFKYNGKNYDSFMNGQNGNVGGKLPLSKVKIFFFVLFILAIIIGAFVLSTL